MTLLGRQEATMAPLRTWEFDKHFDACIIRDASATTHAVLHAQRPVASEGPTAVDAAESHLRAHAELLGLRVQELANLRLRPQDHPINPGTEYRLLSEKPQFDVTTVTFQLTNAGVRVVGAGIGVHLRQMRDSSGAARFETIATQVFRKARIMDDELAATAAAARSDTRYFEPLTSEVLARAVGITPGRASYDVESLQLRHQHLAIYRYEAAKRFRLEETESTGLSLPPVPAEIADGSNRVVAAAYFDLKLRRRSSVHWLALVDTDTRAVLQLEAYAAGIDGMVFMFDPVTSNGGPPVTASNADLKDHRVLVTLQGLENTYPQQLRGSNVTVQDLEGPIHEPPTVPPGRIFDFEVRTNKFAAVNAYFHCDRFFRLVEDLGFKRAEYFPGTSFPIIVDHRGTPHTSPYGGNVVNAQCRMTTLSSSDGSVIGGIEAVVFCLSEDTVPPFIGNASDWRAVLHELGGHGVLFNHVGDSHFGFAHSAGDSLAAILGDPESKAPDPGCTYPWTQYDRRHDWSAQHGWAWDGPFDVGDGGRQMMREQILSSTHFRLYQSIGGDRRAPVKMRHCAARFTTYLILRAIQTLTPVTNPQHASDWLCNLLVADAGELTGEGHAGGAYEKVIRWAFEKQGLFGGEPPPTDVYIDDGRGGEYSYQPNHSACPAIWNRRAPDGNEGHEPPAPGVVNYAYVKIRNRGRETATSLAVDAFQNRAQSGLVYPDDWQPMQTARLPAPDLPSHAEVKVGPFEWVPSASGDNHILMAVSADGDPSNLRKYATGRSIPDGRLVPHDNNLGLRKV